ncbi:hypothetical protein FOQG_19214 [Fusarium oxysporum f. sp. raphani 54005]|uniref:Uncharacterized protein n=1 Tax=Fusarium oxysporum f. sp. raphani 54005 TaxID=1089458 RepID=X0BBY3_FUSOX|nr:hypothetical protein FOQG_19214 [Fusarium oxysporum f. sp. raphani 54005]
MGSRDVERRFSVRLCWIISRKETTVLYSASSLTLATRQSRPWMACCGRLLSNFTKAGVVVQVFLTVHSKHTRMAATNLRQRRSQMFYSRCLQSRRRSLSFWTPWTSRQRGASYSCGSRTQCPAKSCATSS